MNILVAVDLSEKSQMVVVQTKKFTKALSAKIWLLHVANAHPELAFSTWDADNVIPLQDVGEMREIIAKKFKNEHRKLQEFGEELRLAGLDCTALLVQGPIAKTILNEAAKLSADMVILGSQGKGIIDRFFLGSTSEEILHKSPIPVLIVPTHDTA